VMGRVNEPFYQGGGGGACPPGEGDQQSVQERDRGCPAPDPRRGDFGLAQLQATASQIQSAQSSLEANRIALEGVREEEKVGQRTTLDVLNAQLEYLGSQIQLVTAKRDRVVAEYSVFSAVGRLDAQSLGLSVPYYDPLEHYDIVKNKWWSKTATSAGPGRMMLRLQS
jgi:outer membrane protein